MRKKVPSHGCSNGDHHRASRAPGQAAYASVIVAMSAVKRTRWLGNSAQMESVSYMQSVQEDARRLLLRRAKHVAGVW